MISKLCFSVYCILICTCTYDWILISCLNWKLQLCMCFWIIKKFESEVVSFSVHCLMTWYVYNSSHNCVGNNIVVVLLVLVKICHIMTQRCFMLCTTFDPSFVHYHVIKQCTEKETTSLSNFLLTIKLNYLHDLKNMFQCLLHLITYIIEITPNLHV
jgi:hypothetical protein